MLPPFVLAAMAAPTTGTGPEPPTGPNAQQGQVNEATRSAIAFVQGWCKRLHLDGRDAAVAESMITVRVAHVLRAASNFDNAAQRL
jgi:hypothetical protein